MLIALQDLAQVFASNEGTFLRPRVGSIALRSQKVTCQTLSYLPCLPLQAVKRSRYIQGEINLIWR